MCFFWNSVFLNSIAFGFCFCHNDRKSSLLFPCVMANLVTMLLIQHCHPLESGQPFLIIDPDEDASYHCAMIEKSSFSRSGKPHNDPCHGFIFLSFCPLSRFGLSAERRSRFLWGAVSRWDGRKIHPISEDRHPKNGGPIEIWCLCLNWTSASCTLWKNEELFC